MKHLVIPMSLALALAGIVVGPVSAQPKTSGKLIPIYPDNDKDGWTDERQKPLAWVTPEAIRQGVFKEKPIGDCDDQDRSIFPGAREWNNGKDDDCDGKVDEDLFMQEEICVPRRPDHPCKPCQISYRTKGGWLANCIGYKPPAQ